MKTSMDPIGIVGVGLVGSALAELLIANGYRVVGYDIAGEKNAALAAMGGRPVDSPAEVAERCRRIVLSLMTTAIGREVVEGTDGIMKAGRLPACIIDTTTGDPEETEALAARLATDGIAYLDATISGSSGQIRRRAGTIMVGGTSEDFENNRDLFEAWSDKAYHLGPVGSGSRAKLASNLVLGLNRVVLAEGLVFAEGLGLDLPVFLDVLKDSPARSAAMDTKGEQMLKSSFAPVSRIRQHLKDVELILEYAGKSRIELPLTVVHRELLEGAVATGDGDLDNAAVIREIRRRGDRGRE